MFGILKSGIKLGVGCFVTIVLFLGLIAGGIWYYFIRTPKPSNTKRRASVLQVEPSAIDQSRPARL
jgi:hypothetical protein